MHYVWAHKLWDGRPMATVDGRPVKVVDPGRWNTDAGPDFFNAKVKIGDEMWVGNVEMHLRASDWYRHGHDDDPAYSSVILHVVAHDDSPVPRPGGKGDDDLIPQMTMQISPDIQARAQELERAPVLSLPCSRWMAEMPRLYLMDWLTSLGFERLYGKADRLRQQCERLHGNWEQVAYQALSRSMGMSVNNDTFERLAMVTPVNMLRKHADNILAVEALLFGQAALLEPTQGDPYVERLTTEYQFLAHKYGLRALDPGAWRMGHMRPWNFPHRRIATLAALITTRPNLMADLTAITTVAECQRYFEIELSGYWAHRFRFGGVAATGTKAFSGDVCKLLMINVVSPLRVAFGQERGDSEAVAQAVEMLQDLPPERNSIVKMFEEAGVKATDAFTSQALIELRRAYCEPRKCLYCRIGHRMLSQAAWRPS